MMNLKLKLLFAFSIVCMIIGIVFIVVGKIREYDEVTERIVTIIDAGGSGTRLHVYKYIDQLESTTIKCEKTGLGNYPETEYPNVAKVLKECYVKGRELLPKGAVKSPVWFGATAGMRVLKLRYPDRYTKIWNMVKESLNNSDYDVKWSDTFPGNFEARFSWIAANLLKNAFESKETVGMAEMGSTSLQLAFQVDESANTEKHISHIDLHNGKKLNLYEYSYLCYGDAEINRRIQAQLVKNSGFSSTAEDPCSFKGYNWTRTSDYLWSAPCVKGDFAKKHFGEEIDGPAGNFTLIGTGDAQKCLNLIETIITSNCTNTSVPCGMEDVYQAKLHGKYLALASFYYTADYIGVPDDSSPQDYWQKTTDICKRRFDDLTPPYKEISETFKSKYCMQSVIGYFLLSKGFKFDNKTWNIDFTKKIDGKDIAWTLGAAYYYQSEAYTHQVEQLCKGFRAMFIVGILITIISLILLIMAIVMCHKGDGTYETVQ